MLGTENIKITPTLLALVCEIDEFKGFWNALSAHTTGLNMLREVAEFGGDFKKIMGPLQGKPLTPAILSVLHAAQLKQPGQSPYRALEYATQIGDAGALETADPEDVKALTNKLTGWLDKTLSAGNIHPLLAIAIFTAVLLQISPYEDDNLKFTRFLITVLMLRSGYAYAPYVSLDRAMHEKASEIFGALKTLQESLERGKPDWNGWLMCFLSLLKDQKAALQARIYARDKDMAHLPTLSGRILKLFEHNNRLQMKQIVKLTNGRRSTIKLRLGEMVEEGYVRRYGNARATWYSLI